MTKYMNFKFKNPEDYLQASCVRTFDLQYPLLSKVLFAIPNGGKRTKFEAILFKLTGVRSGVADLFLSVARCNYHGLYIEMKQPYRYQTHTQKDFQRDVEKQNYKYVVIKTYEDFNELIKKYMNNELE